MKKIAILVCCSLIMFNLSAQKKKNVLQHNIKSITVIEEDHEQSKGKQVKESFTAFDESGNVTEEIEYDDKGKEKKHTVYAFDDDGNKIRETSLNLKGEKEKVIEYKYQDGMKTERIVYLPNGKMKSRKLYKYDFH